MVSISLNAISGAGPQPTELLSRTSTSASGMTSFVTALDDAESADAAVSDAAPVYYNPTAGTPGTPQYDALANPEVAYIAPGIGQGGESLPGFTPTSARAWWTAWFASPYDLRLVDPAALPGSLVLTKDQAIQAIALNQTTLPPPPSSEPANPNLYEGSNTLAIIRREIAAGNPNYPPFAEGVTFGPLPTSASNVTNATTRALSTTTAAEVAAIAGTRTPPSAKAKEPTAAQLATIKARAIAAGHRPTHKQVLATYYRYA